MSLSILYDFYMANEKTIEGDANKEEEENVAKNKKPISNEPIDKEAQINKKLMTAAKVIERMVNINTFDDIAKDYRFYEEPADEATYPEGSLMPLWKFKVFKDRKDVEVTGLQWSPKYPDMFGVSYGSLTFIKNPKKATYACTP